MYGRAIWWVSCLASLTFLATALRGFRGDGFGVNHLTLALVATLAVIFTQLWTVIYLRFAERELPGFVGGGPGVALVLPLAVIASVLVTVVLGGAAYSYSRPGAFHGWGFWLSLGLQTLGLVLSRRRFGALEGAVARAVAQGA